MCRSVCRWDLVGPLGRCAVVGRSRTWLGLWAALGLGLAFGALCQRSHALHQATHVGDDVLDDGDADPVAGAFETAKAKVRCGRTDS